MAFGSLSGRVFLLHGAANQLLASKFGQTLWITRPSVNEESKCSFHPESEPEYSFSQQDFPCVINLS